MTEQKKRLRKFNIHAEWVTASGATSVRDAMVRASTAQEAIDQVTAEIVAQDSDAAGTLIVKRKQRAASA